MTALIVWASIIGYVGIALWIHPKLTYKAYISGNKTYPHAGYSKGEAALTGMAQSLIWPLMLVALRSEKYIEKEVEFEVQMKKVREQIEEQKKLERRKAQAELDAFDREIRNAK